MRYYITSPVNEQKAKEDDYRIIKVKETDEAGFLEDYGHQILASGSSMLEALLQFQQWKADQEGE